MLCSYATEQFSDAITVIHKNDRSPRGKATPRVPVIQNDLLVLGKLIEPFPHLSNRDCERRGNLPSPRGTREADINQDEILVAGI